MKKKYIAYMLSVIVIMTSAACGKTAEETIPEAALEESREPADHDHEHEHNFDVADELYSVELTLPAEYVGETTQSELDNLAQKNAYKSITLNEDGSATYIMSEYQHEYLLDSVGQNIEEQLEALIGTVEYSNLAKVETNDDYTEFTILTISDSITDQEDMAVNICLMLAGIYQVYQGDEIDHASIEVINYDTNDEIYSCSSEDFIE